MAGGRDALAVLKVEDEVLHTSVRTQSFAENRRVVSAVLRAELRSRPTRVPVVRLSYGTENGPNPWRSPFDRSSFEVPWQNP